MKKPNWHKLGDTTKSYRVLFLKKISNHCIDILSPWMLRGFEGKHLQVRYKFYNRILTTLSLGRRFIISQIFMTCGNITEIAETMVGV